MVDERKAEGAGRGRLPDRRFDFGATLREARERKGVSLREIADATKISVRALEALERNDISQLPGGIFSRAFVRAYATEAGLNPDQTVEEFVRHFPHETVTEGHAASVGVDVAVDESVRRSARVAVGLAGVSVPVAAVVLYLTLVAHRAPSATGGTAVAATTAPAVSTSSATVTGRVRVEVTALRPCIVTAGVDGQPLVDAHLEAGSRQSFDARSELVMTVSDPSAIELSINDLRGRRLGADGTMTTVRLTPENYREFVAAP
jgi:hypothetical protein